MSGKGCVLTFEDVGQAIRALEKSYARNNGRSKTDFLFVEAENHLNTFNPSAVEMEGKDVLSILAMSIKHITVQTHAGGMMAMIATNDAREYWERGTKLTTDHVMGFET